MTDITGWMRTFITVADAASFSRAAARLELPQSTVSRQVSALERHLGAALLKRTTRSIALTSEGQAYYEAALRALAAIDEAAASVGLHGALGGQVRLTAPLTLAQSRVIPMLADFQRLQPRIEIDLRLSDHALNLVSDNLDFAIRVGAIGDSRAIARRIGVARRVMVASPAYLDEYGVPHQPSDLQAHNCLSYALLATGNKWVLGNDTQVEVSGTFRADSPDALRVAALAGIGIAVNARWLFEDDLAAGRLVEVLPDHPPADMPIHLVMPAGRYIAARVRALADHLIAAFAADPLLRTP
ncbi:LysR family transcriptional regulator [Novosphingobium sediminis]|uniref:LysR family transcriptional regulator n=1 Tax=Novosphingobium sediminis TaxID=707214 RepID=A0A512AP65_9SPHN|nr:LysR family transcriptional regulator [Novosphingobium sediminis]GEO01499.1 LysR family transcriptional regulator [Novosphingobium sediminis]